jgi:hypothetical protein
MKKSKTTQYVHHAIRIFTGLFFLGVFTSKFEIGVSGLNNPDVFTPEGWAFITAIKEIRYLFPFIGIVGLISGLAILANRYVAIAAIIMIPITLFESIHALQRALAVCCAIKTINVVEIVGKGRIK